MAKQFLLYINNGDFWFGALDYKTEKSALQAWKDLQKLDDRYVKCKIFDRNGGVSFYGRNVVEPINNSK